MSRTPSAQSLPLQDTPRGARSSSRTPEPDYAETPTGGAASDSVLEDADYEAAEIEQLRETLGARYVSVEAVAAQQHTSTSQHHRVEHHQQQQSLRSCERQRMQHRYGFHVRIWPQSCLLALCSCAAVMHLNPAHYA